MLYLIDCNNWTGLSSSTINPFLCQKHTTIFLFSFMTTFVYWAQASPTALSIPTSNTLWQGVSSVFLQHFYSTINWQHLMSSPESALWIFNFATTLNYTPPPLPTPIPITNTHTGKDVHIQIWSLFSRMHLKLQFTINFLPWDKNNKTTQWWHNSQL